MTADTAALNPRYRARYRDGYWVVIDTQTGAVVPPPAGHYKRHADGYLWPDAAALMANQYNAEGGPSEPSCTTRTPEESDDD